MDGAITTANHCVAYLLNRYAPGFKPVRALHSNHDASLIPALISRHWHGWAACAGP